MDAVTISPEFQVVIPRKRTAKRMGRTAPATKASAGQAGGQHAPAPAGYAPDVRVSSTGFAACQRG